ncbi:MAG: hypothetical protein HY556_09210 [Euryarchaeota archaeon]|nr:hypothetical protein [Euryarchaeota archaeon]
MTSKKVLGLAFVAVAALAFIVLAPAAEAQATQTNTNVIITPINEKVKPLAGSVSMPIKVCYTYTPSSTASLLPTKVTITAASEQSYFIVTPVPSTRFFAIKTANPTQQGSGAQVQDCSLDGEIVVQVSATAEAPAFTPTGITVDAAAAANGANLEPSNSNTKVTVEADFFSILDASTPISIIKATPQQEVPYPITVTNLGNAQTKVFFDVDSKPPEWQVTVPPPITLEAKSAGGTRNQKVATVVVLTPYKNGYMNIAGAITIKITSNYAFDPQKIGDRTLVSTLTIDKGFYVPGFEPLALLGGALGVAAATGRFRRPG